LPQVLRWSAAGAAVCGAGLLRVGREAAQGREAGAADFFSLSISDLRKEEIKRNQKKSVSGYAEIICSNFANENRRTKREQNQAGLDYAE
jgi:hypothetical protein